MYNTRIPKLLHPYLTAIQISFNGICLVKGNKPVTKEKVLNRYIVYRLDNTSHSFHPRLKNCLFGSVNITKKNTDFNGQILSGYGVAFYTDYVFKHGNSFACNTVFGVDSAKDGNMLAIGQGNIKFDNKTINVKAPYKSNIRATKTKLALNMHYNKQFY